MPGGKIRILISEELYEAIDARVHEENTMFEPPGKVTVEEYVESVMRVMVGCKKKDPDYDWMKGRG